MNLFRSALILAALQLPFTIQTLRPLPEVWLGDRTNQCIIIVNTDKSTSECPEDLSELPQPHTPVYVIEETDYE